MIRGLRERYDFANVPRDRWLASQGKLPGTEVEFLRVRERRLAQYQLLKRLLLWPVDLVRGCINAVHVLGEFERLHAAPLRRIRRGRDCVIDRQTWLVNGERIELGDWVKISAFSTVIAGYECGVKIGTNTIIGPGALIVAINHGMAPTGEPIRYQAWKEAPVIIGEDVWIGGGAIVLPGTTIGPGAVIGAGAIVKGTVPAGAVATMREGVLSFRERQ